MSLLKLRMAPEAEDVRSLVLFSHYDASPILVKFGTYVDLVTPFARYLHFNAELQKWQALPIDKFRDLAQRSVPRKGVVQVLAQRMQVVIKLGLRSHAASCVLINASSSWRPAAHSFRVQRRWAPKERVQPVSRCRLALHHIATAGGGGNRFTRFAQALQMVWNVLTCW